MPCSSHDGLRAEIVDTAKGLIGPEKRDYAELIYD